MRRISNGYRTVVAPNGDAGTVPRAGRLSVRRQSQVKTTVSSFYRPDNVHRSTCTKLLGSYITERKLTGVDVVIACDDVGPDVVGADVVGAMVVVGCGVDGADVEVVVRDGSCVVVGPAVVAGPAVVVGPTVVVAGCGVVPV